MADPHFTRICKVCETPYQATKTKSGNLRKTKYQVCSPACREKIIYRFPPGLTFHRGCAYCGVDMVIAENRKGKRETCSRTCSVKLTHKRAGNNTEVSLSLCGWCLKPIGRRIQLTNDSGKFCSRKCSFDMLAMIKEERDGLKRIGQRRRSIDRIRKEVVESEVSALMRIAADIRIRATSCLGCGKSHIRRRKLSRFCTEACRGCHKKKMRELNRQSEASKRASRIAKSKRRALVRTTQVENIDPIAVFNRDKWVCHLCRRKTLPSRRGTKDARAPELEHIVSLANGGTHTWGNVACACRGCNIAKGAKDFGQIGMDIAC